MTAVREVIDSALVEIGRQYARVRLTALLAGPFYGLVTTWINRIQGPSFLVFPAMLGHRRSIASYENPNGDGKWISAVGEAQDAFSDFERMQVLDIHKSERRAAFWWWTVAATLGTGCIALFAMGMEYACAYALCVFGGMALLSLLGYAVAHPFVSAMLAEAELSLVEVSEALPDRLWEALDKDSVAEISALAA